MDQSQPHQVEFNAEIRDDSDDTVEDEDCPFSANVDFYQDDNAQTSVSLQTRRRRDGQNTTLESVRFVFHLYCVHLKI